MRGASDALPAKATQHKRFPPLPVVKFDMQNRVGFTVGLARGSRMWSILWNRLDIWKQFRLFWIKSS